MTKFEIAIRGWPAYVVAGSMGLLALAMVAYGTAALLFGLPPSGDGLNLSE